MPTSSRLSVPVILGIIATIVFCLLPIQIGHEYLLYGAFIMYGGLVVLLAALDRRVLGYATVLSVCNPANPFRIPYPLVLCALVCILYYSHVREVMGRLARTWWWPLFVVAYLGAFLTAPFWGPGLREFVVEARDASHRLGFLVLLPIVVGACFTSSRDALRAVLLLILLAVGIQSLFYFAGTKGFPDDIVSFARLRVRETYHAVGHSWLNYNRTLVCISVAALTAGCFGVVMTSRNIVVRLIYAGLTIPCGYMLMTLASTGSALALACGVVAICLAYGALYRSLKGMAILLVLGGAGLVSLYALLFLFDSELAQRLALKIRQSNEGYIDRWTRWVMSIESIAVTVLGRGFTTRIPHTENDTHNDFFVYFVSYGWVTGAAYATGVAIVLARFVKRIRAAKWTEPAVQRLLIIGIGVCSVYIVNSILDMLSASVVYYQTVWAIILTAATGALLFEQEAPLRVDYAMAQ
jgi:hypothetical protein